MRGPQERDSEGAASGPPESSGSDAGPLRELVRAVLERLDEEGPAALARACQEHPDLAPALERRMALLADLGLVDVGEAEGSEGGTLERVGDFRLLEAVGSGGMGVVYRAEQVSLGREVALKLIRPDFLYQSGARERFARETAIVAKLAHPGIVPIHVVGGDDDVPYYAMEYVPGCTLAEALQELGAESPEGLTGADLWLSIARVTRRISSTQRVDGLDAPSSLFQGSWEQACLRILARLSEAVGHAHARGVLHRDLKPSNVMITPTGRVMLMDFGLSQSEGADSMTQSGARIGSLPYMPPELLRDGPQVLDRRSDVYGLGVTLYELATLQLPFVAPSVPGLVAQILEGRPVRPRAHHAGLSWEIETVCLAALDRDPGRRYASAEDLTRDLVHVLDGRPIEARRASLALRARRWVQRRPAEAAAALLVLLLPTTAAFLLAREARTVAAAYESVESNRSRAIRAIEAMLVRVTDDAFDGTPGMFTLREDLLGEAARLYEELCDERPDDLEAVLLAGRCGELWNRMLRDDGRYADAEAVARHALERMEPWADDPPPELRRMRAGLFDDLKFALRLQERHADAYRAASEAIAVMRAVVRDEPQDVPSQEILLSMIIDQADGLNLSNDASGDGSVAVLRAALVELRALQREHGIDMRRPIVGAMKALAHGLAVSGDHTGSAEVLGEERELLAELVRESPRDSELRFKLAQAGSLEAGELIEAGDSTEAPLALLDEAAAVLEERLRESPGVAELEYLAAHIAGYRSTALANLELYDESRWAAEEGMAVLEGLCERFPGNAEYQRTLGVLVIRIGIVEASTGEGEAALATCAWAEELFRAALEVRPDSEEWQKWLAITDLTRAKALVALERYGDAGEALVRSVAGVGVGRRADVAESGVGRMAHCLTLAREEATPEELERCRRAAVDVLAVATERGDLAGSAHLEALRDVLAE